MNTDQKNIFLSIVYFLLSVLLTGFFIMPKFWLYSSTCAMLLSGCIAGVKWLIQIVAAFIFLKANKWVFLRRIGSTCLLGSSLLFSYNLLTYFHTPLSGFSQFVLAIGLSVLAMMLMYYKAVQKTGLSIRWFWAWMLSVVIAITLQFIIIF